MNVVLDVDRLSVALTTRERQVVRPVQEVSLTLSRGETLALVGESGCGKSMTCLALSGLLPRRAEAAAARFELAGTPLDERRPRHAARLRRRHVAVVFQDATNALNPVKSIGWQIAEAVRLRAGTGWRAARREALELLRRVGMPEPERRVAAFPHQLSGGMNQRAMIAMAIAGRPDLLIADEATTALDVTVQAQILALIADLQRESGMGVIFVTHDLGIVAQIATEVAVMYAGRIVERGPVQDLFADPRHPYTAALLAALPRVDRRNEALRPIPGQVPPIHGMPPGCAFAPRCGAADARCGGAIPPARAFGTRRMAACHHAPMPAP